MCNASLYAVGLLAASVLSAGEAGLSIELRTNTPWNHLFAEASQAEKNGEYAKAAAAYKTAIGLISGVSREDRLELAFALNCLGVLYDAQGRPQDAAPAYKKALAVWTDVLGSTDPITAVALSNLGESYASMGDYEEARRVQPEALKIHATAAGPNSPLVVNDLNKLAVISDVSFASASPNAVSGAPSTSLIHPIPRIRTYRTLWETSHGC